MIGNVAGLRLYNSGGRMRFDGQPINASPLTDYLGRFIGSGQCVALVQAACGMPVTALWKRGVKVRGALVVPGTVIATFNEAGHYPNTDHGDSHAAVYLGQDADGLEVVDQWVGMPVHFRTIHFHGDDPLKTAVNNGDKFYVVTL